MSNHFTFFGTMTRCVLVLFMVLFISHPKAGAQSYFADGLDADFHKSRREALRAEMLPNSVAIFFAAPVQNRANDVDYVYHPNPDFFYLTGFREPNAALVIFSEEVELAGKKFNEVIFVQPRNEREEMWNGKRLGIEGVKEKLKFQEVRLNSEFKDFPLDWKAKDMVLTLPVFMTEEARKSNNPLNEMKASFKKKSGYPEDISELTMEMYALIRSTEIENSANVAQVIGRYMRFYPELQNDNIIISFTEAPSDEERQKVKDQLPKTNIEIAALNQIMDALREIKTKEELIMLKKAIYVSAIGQVEVMKAIKPGMSEREVQGIHEFVYKKYGAEDIGYPSIVGAGHNGCVLHYIDNDKDKIGNNLILMDLGAEYRGYTADVTRTIPANGKFSPEQKAIYDLVYEAQEAAFAVCRPGASFRTPHAEAMKVINAGLQRLGIIQEGQRHNYLPHGTSHHLGLDVHDRGTYDELKEGMVITVEPGIYIPENSPCDPKWWGIAVRIEDDLLITKNGYENLSAYAPRKSDEIEKMMKQKSALDGFLLPDLDKMIK